MALAELAEEERMYIKKSPVLPSVILTHESQLPLLFLFPPCAHAFCITAALNAATTPLTSQASRLVEMFQGDHRHL
jgi:hypothetical protein